MAENFLDILLALIIILVAAKASGYVSLRLRQPSVLGELLAGVILGPTVLNMVHTWPVFQNSQVVLEEFITLMAEIGVILLMLLAGLELQLSELMKTGKVAVLAGTSGVMLPLGLGWTTAALFGTGHVEGLFVGLALSATSVSISAQTLLEMGVLRSRVGLGLLGAAVFDDVLVILLLSISFILVGGSAQGMEDVLITLLRMAGYFGGTAVLGIWLVPRLVSWVDRLPISQGTMASVLALTLFFAWAAEVVGGIATITGAFLVGLFLARLPFHARIEEGISTLAYSLFVPIFFVNIGLAVNLRAISGSTWWLALAITAVAIFSKIAGCGLGAKLGGFRNREALQLGIGMVSRGEVGLIVAAFALSESLISLQNFSMVVFTVIAATLLTPPMLRQAFRKELRKRTAVSP